MDSRLVITVLLATLSWGFLGTYGQSTATPDVTNVTSGTMTSMNMTSADMTSGGNMLSVPTTTTSAPNTMVSITTAATTTMVSTMTSTPKTMVSTTTSAPKTMVSTLTTMASRPNTMTTAAPQTMTASTAAPFTVNTTVANLTMSPSRTDCGSSRLCVAEPSSCDPSAGGSCFFFSVMQLSGQDFRCELSGQSDGYLGTALSVDTMLGGNDTTYICANNNGNVQFIGALLDNGMLTATTLDVNNVTGRVSGGTIQCIFTVRVPPATTTRTTSFSASIITGTFDPTSGALGTPTARVTTNVVNLADANATVTNMATNSTTNTTASPATTAHGVTVHSSLMQSLLITLIVVGLAML